jgi:two-component system response regulator PilR (NtrC family)
MEDIPELVDSLLVKLCGEQRPPRLAEGALRALATYSFPGNVRELENVLERATALCSGSVIEVCDLQMGPDDMGGENIGRGSETLDDYLNRLERQAILEALQKTEGNRTAAARVLGITFRSLRYRLERLGIE